MSARAITAISTPVGAWASSDGVNKLEVRVTGATGSFKSFTKFY